MPSSAQTGSTSFSGSLHHSEITLDCGDNLDGVGFADRLRPGFGQAEVPDLALCDQVRDRAGDLFYRYVRIDSVLVEQVDRLDAEAPERSVGRLSDQLGAARRPSGRVDLPELRGHDDLIPNGCKRVAHELLVRERAIDLRRVKSVTPRSTASRISAIASFRSRVALR